MKDDNQLDPVVVSSCIFLEDKTSEKQTDGILEKLNLLKKRLRRLGEVVEEMFPDKIHNMLPSDNNIDISKMGYGGTITTDKCNSDRKTRRIQVERIESTIQEMDCTHHMWNVWFGGVEKIQRERNFDPEAKGGQLTFPPHIWSLILEQLVN